MAPAPESYLNVKTEPDLEFRLLSFAGHEELSRLFSFKLEMDSPKMDIKPESIIGKPISFNIARKDEPKRFFHGFVGRFSAGTGESGFRRYEAEVVPWLWFLTQRTDCRIFSGKTVPEIIELVFEKYPIGTHQALSPTRTYEPREYCVQYRETDFNFISRLLEEEGIYYFFKHTENDHQLIFGDNPLHYSKEATDVAQVRYEYTRSAKFNMVTSWLHEYKFVPGQYAQTDYNFIQHPSRGTHTPASLLLTNENVSGKPPVIAAPYEIFDYPGEYSTTGSGRSFTKVRLEEEEVAYNVVSGTSHSQSFSPGIVFGLTEHPTASENGDYVVLSVDHSASDNTTTNTGSQLYRNSFTSLPAAVPFRPARVTRKPTINGSQTAVVVGPPGSEIFPDEHGRVQVQFFWDRIGTRLQGSQSKKPTPAWIRVGQIIAGKNWGAMFIPRVGQEVIVTFLEGDPDSPIITGVVYNGEQQPAYDPKANATKSYIKTNSSPGGQGYNELLFEDKKGEEMLFLHAQRNMDVTVLANSQERIYNDRHLIVGNEKNGGEGSQRELVHMYKDLHVKRHQNEHIEGDYLLTVGKGDAAGSGSMDLLIEKDKRETIEASSHLQVGMDLAEKIGGSQSLTVGGDLNAKIGKNCIVDSGMEVHLKAGMKVILDAGVQITLKCGSNFIDIGPAGVSIMGTMVNINSGGAPGTGTPVNAAAPDEAQKAMPVDPDVAHAHKTGSKSTPF